MLIKTVKDSKKYGGVDGKIMGFFIGPVWRYLNLIFEKYRVFHEKCFFLIAHLTG